MYRQEDTKKHQQDDLIRKNKVRDSKSIIHECSNLKKFCSNNVENNPNRITQQQKITPSDDPT